jgi:hypothetical protein
MQSASNTETAHRMQFGARAEEGGITPSIMLDKYNAIMLAGRGTLSRRK